jgi:pimeloyl-ACP methyl ester carboxylesterase
MTLERIELGALALECEIRGAGEPVLSIHGGAFADGFVPLLEQPALRGYRLIRYRREGYGQSGCLRGPTSIAEQAAQALALARQLGIEHAHVVGHSSGGSIALQLAHDAPEFVSSLALLEAVLPSVPAGRGAADALELHARGEARAAVACFLSAVCGLDYAAVLARALPHALDSATTDAKTFFGRELPALSSWRFGPENAALLRQPLLAVLGAESDAARGATGQPVFAERHRLLLSWFPNAESRVLPGVNHLMLLQDPRGVAECLAEFFAHRPVPRSGAAGKL